MTSPNVVKGDNVRPILEKAMEADKKILLVAQKNASDDDPALSDSSNRNQKLPCRV